MHPSVGMFFSSDMLSELDFTANLLAIFSQTVDMSDTKHRYRAVVAFRNLALHSVEVSFPECLPYVRFDTIKTVTMLNRLHRDSYQVGHFSKWLTTTCGNPKLAASIMSKAGDLSVRINSDKPRKTRVAAAFSLWMSTFRPIFLMQVPKPTPEDIIYLEATVNFNIAIRYLALFGAIQIGGTSDEADDIKARIYYDLTFRGLNLSSLEMLYCGLFRIVPPLEDKEGLSKN